MLWAGSAGELENEDYRALIYQMQAQCSVVYVGSQTLQLASQIWLVTVVVVGAGVQVGEKSQASSSRDSAHYPYVRFYCQ